MNKRDLFFGFTFNQDDKRRKFQCLQISAFVTIDVRTFRWWRSVKKNRRKSKYQSWEKRRELELKYLSHKKHNLNWIQPLFFAQRYTKSTHFFYEYLTFLQPQKPHHLSTVHPSISYGHKRWKICFRNTKIFSEHHRVYIPFLWVCAASAFLRFKMILFIVCLCYMFWCYGVTFELRIFFMKVYIYTTLELLSGCYCLYAMALLWL